MANPVQNYASQWLGLVKSAIELSRISNELVRYRIAQLPTDTCPYVHVQVVNKQDILKVLPEKLMREDFLLGFSKADIAVIAHLGTKNELKSTSFQRLKLFKILRQFINKGKASFAIQKEEGVIEEHAANDLCNDPSITERLTGTDGIKIGYSVAEEHYQRIIKLKRSA